MRALRSSSPRAERLFRAGCDSGSHAFGMRTPGSRHPRGHAGPLAENHAARHAEPGSRRHPQADAHRESAGQCQSGGGMPGLRAAVFAPRHRYLARGDGRSAGGNEGSFWHEPSFADVTLLLVAGGLSSRMGRDKRWLPLGGTGLLERMLLKAQAEHFRAIILCVEDAHPGLKALAERYGAALCLDSSKCQGPMAGLAAGLARMTTQWALVYPAICLFRLCSRPPPAGRMPAGGAGRAARRQRQAAAPRRLLSSITRRGMQGSSCAGRAASWPAHRQDAPY